MLIRLSFKALAVYSIILLLLTSCAGPRPQQSARYDHLRPKLVAMALSMEGTPYRYGGSSPNGFRLQWLSQIQLRTVWL